MLRRNNYYHTSAYLSRWWKCFPLTVTDKAWDMNGAWPWYVEIQLWGEKPWSWPTAAEIQRNFCHPWRQVLLVRTDLFALSKHTVHSLTSAWYDTTRRGGISKKSRKRLWDARPVYLQDTGNLINTPRAHVSVTINKLRVATGRMLNWTRTAHRGSDLWVLASCSILAGCKYSPFVSLSIREVGHCDSCWHPLLKARLEFAMAPILSPQCNWLYLLRTTGRDDILQYIVISKVEGHFIQPFL